MKKILPLILSSALTITVAISTAFAGDYQALQPIQLNIRSGYSEVISGSMPSKSIQTVYFTANYNDIISIVPDERNGDNLITLTVYDINGNIVEKDFGRAVDTFIVFEAPRTGDYKLFITTSSPFNYSYKIKIE